MVDKEKALDFVDRVFYGMNALAIQLSKMSNKKPEYFTSLTELPQEYEEIRKYLRENLK